MQIDWGRTSVCGGYRAVYCPDHHRAWSTGYVHVHVLVAEWKIGRELREGEVVHHEDENKLNNSPENLEVLGNSLHASKHAKPAAPVGLICAQCGKGFERRRGQHPAAKGYKNAFCSRRCNGLFNGRKKAP
jgi:hypothetical protein